MRLDSVRELKLTLIEQILSRKLFGGMPATALAAINVAAEARRQASIALGVSRAGAAGFRLAVRIQQRPLHEGPIVALVRKHARGEADIRYVGRVRPAAPTDPRGPAAWQRTRARPLMMGVSIGHSTATAGTLGAFVADRRGRLAVLSNNHVLAVENRARRGDRIVQPGPIDGGRSPRDTVARLGRFARLKPGSINRVDAAIAGIEPGVDVEPHLLRGLGSLRGISSELGLGDEVWKIGRTTGLTRGRVSAIEIDNIVVDYGIGRLRFDDQVEIEGLGGRGRGSAASGRVFSAAGDSGALIVNADLRGVALLFAGSDHGAPGGGERSLTYASPIGAVLRSLGVTLGPKL